MKYRKVPPTPKQIAANNNFLRTSLKHLREVKRMSTKQENLDNPDSCLNKADADEPVFILRAKDPIAPVVVDFWAMLAEHVEAHELSKQADAHIVSIQMQTWRRETFGNSPLPIYRKDSKQ